MINLLNWIIDHPLASFLIWIALCGLIETHNVGKRH